MLANTQLLHFPMVYKRLEHFTELLTRMKMLDQAIIPDEVIEQIRNKLNRDGLVVDNLDRALVKKYLKEEGWQKHYDIIMQILQKFEQIEPLQLSVEDKHQLEDLFMNLAIAYHEIWPNCSFFSYPFILDKFADLMDIPSLKGYFPFIHNPAKRAYQEAKWTKVCQKMGIHCKNEN